MSGLATMEAVTIDRRFNGPPDSANGGYAAGRLAECLGGIVEVTLRRPPPLGRPLQIARAGERSARLMDGDLVVVEARSVDALELDAVPAPDVAAAAACGARYRGFEHHAFPTCFVCGPSRAEGDGLRIFPGPCTRDGTGAEESSRGPVACTWVPAASLGDGTGTVATPFVWSALDCPGYFAVAEANEAAVLGRMTVELLEAPRVGETYVVVGWSVGRDGRKLEAGTALHDADGRIVARARQTWIVLRPDARD
jgi:acyl-coenzyme A thioesterase PaaI-like protein